MQKENFPSLCTLPGLLKSLVVLSLTAMISVTALANNQNNAITSKPLILRNRLEKQKAIQVRVDQSQYMSMKSGPASQTILFPTPDGRNLPLELERFNITTPRSRFKIGSPAGDIDFTRPDVIMYRGKIAGEPLSRAFIAFTGQGSGGGYVTTANGETYFMAQRPSDIGKPDGQGLIIHKSDFAGEMPDFKEYCRAILPDELPVHNDKAGHPYTVSNAGMRVANVAIDAEELFANIFPDVDAAADYVVMLFGVISDIYEHDLNIRFNISFLRFWPSGGEPFGTDDIDGFRNYWWQNEDTTGINVVHLLTARRDLEYGGLGYVGGTCIAGAYATTGYLNGHFPLPVGIPNAGNWDIIVVAHEIGHNFYGIHTHDDWFFDPPIDSCGSYGIYTRSTIMSYCHTTTGYTSNLDLRFHRRVQEWMEDDIVNGGCLWFDCNNNGDDDSRDIALGISNDANDNLIPDECEDCNNNGILDDADIAGGMPDINNDGIPDECEDDCNGNSIPDEYETREGMAADENGNCIPDECDVDCNDNGTPDFVEVASGAVPDVDNNGIPDECQDCNDNGISDWLDLEREFNFYLVSGDGYVREYHGTNGYPIQNIGQGSLTVPSACAFGPDRQLYVTSAAGIDKIDVDNGTVGNFVTIGSGGLALPTFLTFGPDGNLYVSDASTSEVFQYSGSTGGFMSVFVSAGSGGLVGPWGLTFGPGGNLFVTSGNDAVYEYDGATGAFVGVFVSSGSGGLTSPRGIAFASDGTLLVANYGGGNILAYDASGSFIGIFNDTVYDTITPWDLTIGPSGNVFVPKITGPLQVYEYEYPSGRYFRRYVRDDQSMTSPLGMAFRPKSNNDLDGNYILDECDNCTDTDGDGYGDPWHLENTCLADNCPGDYNPDQTDSDFDGIGNACDACPNDPYNDRDGDGLCGDVDNCPTVSNAGQEDADGDGIGDVCDNCPDNENPHQQDADKDFVGDICDNCPEYYNPSQQNGDADTLGDACDNCPADDNNDQTDGDSDGVGDICDNCPEDYNPEQNDICSYICGDANGDGTHNIFDITYLITYLYLGGPAPDPLEAGDANGDGTINIFDITYLITYLYLEGPEPICP